VNDFLVPPGPATLAVGEKAWTDFKELVDHYGPCSDGAIAEMFADQTIWMLGKHWQAALRFEPLQKKSAFRTFVERYPGTTSGPEDVELVRLKATHQCDVRAAAGFCKRMKKLTAWAPKALHAPKQPAEK
jgi:hypothetical protein